MGDNNHTSYEYHIGVKSCSGEYQSQVPCFRAVITGALAIITLVACFVKLWRAIQIKLSQTEHVESHFVVCFGLAAAELIILIYRWIVGGDTTEHFAAIYLHVIQFLLLIVYYTKRVLLVNRKGELIARLCYPVAALILLYFTIVLGFAVTYRYADTDECQSVVWILFSGSMIALAALFVLLGVHLTRAMNKFPTSDPSLVWWKRFHLWILISAYTVASIVELSFDLAFAYLTEHTQNCDVVYGGPASFGYTMYVLTERLSLLGPIWVMLWVLKCGTVIKNLNDSQDRGASVSVFRTSRSTGSLDSATQWDNDTLSNFDINGVFEDNSTEASTLLVTSSQSAYKTYS